jgi:hypothetical protein
VGKVKAALASANPGQLLAGVNRIVADRFAAWVKRSVSHDAGQTKEPAWAAQAPSNHVT